VVKKRAEHFWKKAKTTTLMWFIFYFLGPRSFLTVSFVLVAGNTFGQRISLYAADKMCQPNRLRRLFT